MENVDSMTPLPDPAQTERLTDWKKEPSLQALKGDLEAGKPAHDAVMNEIREWNALMQVKGSAKPPKVKGRSQVQPKLVRRQAEWRYAPLSEPFLSSSKLFKLTPVTWEDEDAARQNELVLNYQFRTQLNRIKLIDDFVRSNVDDGTAIANAASDRLLQRLNAILADQATPDTGGAKRSKTATQAINMLANVLEKSIDRNRVLAETADKARAAGLTCEKAYTAIAK